MNQIVIWNDLRLFYGSNPRAVTEHSHPIVQFVLATEDQFLSKDDTGGWTKKRGLLIAPNYFHECDELLRTFIFVRVCTYPHTRVAQDPHKSAH
jgi:hypothetical protein